MTFKLSLQDQTYHGIFNLNVVRNFCRAKNYKNIEQYLERIAAIDFEKLGFDDLDDIMLLVIFAVEEQARIDHTNVQLTVEDIYEHGIESIAGALSALAGSMPQAEEEGAPAGNAPEASPDEPAGTASNK